MTIRSQQWKTMTIKADHDLISKLFDIFLSEVQVLRNVSGVIPSSNLQPISHMAAVGARKNGGNVFGFAKEDKDLIRNSLLPKYLLYSTAESACRIQRHDLLQAQQR